MENSKKFLTVFLFLFSAAICITSCSDSNESNTSRITVKLVDAPGDYEAVNIDVQDIMIKRSENGDEENGWQSISTESMAGVYNLLDFVGGNELLLADSLIPSGKLNQIRLVLGDHNSVVIAGESFPLATPSALQSGLKLLVNETLAPGFNYSFTLDFDADDSVVPEGNGDYSLKPVIRISAEVSSGIIAGSVTPFDGQIEISVMVGEDTISTYADETGAFVLYGIPEGVYTVTITPDAASGLSAVTLNDVEVMNGETTQTGEITLE